MTQIKKLTIITFGHYKGRIQWTADHEGHIIASAPDEDYTGCHVVDMAGLKPGQKAKYQTPTRKRTIELEAVITSINQITT